MRVRAKGELRLCAGCEEEGSFEEKRLRIFSGVFALLLNIRIWGIEGSLKVILGFFLLCIFGEIRRVFFRSFFLLICLRVGVGNRESFYRVILGGFFVVRFWRKDEGFFRSFFAGSRWEPRCVYAREDRESFLRL